MRIGYFFRVCSGATFSKLSGAINTVTHKSGKNKAGIFFDMVGCFFLNTERDIMTMFCLNTTI